MNRFTVIYWILPADKLLLIVIEFDDIPFEPNYSTYNLEISSLCQRSQFKFSVNNNSVTVKRTTITVARLVVLIQEPLSCTFLCTLVVVFCRGYGIEPSSYNRQRCRLPLVLLLLLLRELGSYCEACCKGAQNSVLVWVKKVKIN